MIYVIVFPRKTSNSAGRGVFSGSAANFTHPLPLKTIISIKHVMIFSSSEQTVQHSKIGLDVETRRLLVFHVYDKVFRKGFKSPNTQYSDLHTGRQRNKVSPTCFTC
jgi:hypothetical protein